jgi:serine/threonine protein kinase
MSFYREELMDTPSPALELGPTALPLGTKVGAWRVYGVCGQGAYGTVYRAMPEGLALTGPVALKLAVYPGDARFEREVELLSRIRHPSVPRLLDSGLWPSPSGGSHPFVVMEWVEGEPLYTWVARRNPCSREVLALLAQAAGALQATHEVSGVHRDVKGDNMLVRASDGRLFLTDLGSGYFARAARLTPVNSLPGTPAYRSPGLWEYARWGKPGATAALLARPEDDVFALGVTAYRLVTDTYPLFIHPDLKQGKSWLPGGNGAVAPRQLNPRVDAQLNALILRMLSPRPEERGTAGELAQAMERGVAHAGPPASVPLFDWETLKSSEWTEEDLAEAEQLGHRPRRRNRERALVAAQADVTQRAQWERREAEARAPTACPAQRVKPRRWLPWLAAVLALGLWPEGTTLRQTGTQIPAARNASGKKPDAVSVGETALRSSAVLAISPNKEGITEEFPEQPLPGQLKADAKGRCPNRQVAIHGGCWAKVEFELKECSTIGFVYQGACYVIVRAPVKVPTSAPRGK